MRRDTQDVWPHRFAMMLAVATLFLVTLGGVVTTKGVGMAVPDWPTTYGQHMFFFPYSQWDGGVFYEHSHRLLASLVGMLTAILLLWVWVRDTAGRERVMGILSVVAALGLMGVRVPAFFAAFAVVALGAIVYAAVRWQRERSLRWLLVVAFGAVIVQGVLGGLRVTLDGLGWGTPLGIFHAALAQLFFLLVGSIALLTSGWARRSVPQAGGPALRALVLVTTGIIFVQLILGATMRHQHAGLAVPDFPLAYGKLWPATDAASITTYNQTRLEAAGEQPITAAHVVVHMLHRFTAVLILLLVSAQACLAWRHGAKGSLARPLAAIWMLLVLLQVTLGALAIWSQRKVDVTTAHVAVGALTFLVGWLSFLAGSRTRVESSVALQEIDVIAPKGAELKHA